MEEKRTSPLNLRGDRGELIYFHDIEFEIVDSLPGREDDFAHYDPATKKIKVLNTLWELIKDDAPAQNILRRHEYVENVLIPTLEERGLIILEGNANEKARERHMLASAVDISFEGTAAHALMKHVIQLLSEEELLAIEPKHWNDPKSLHGNFYQSVQEELRRRSSHSKKASLQRDTVNEVLSPDIQVAVRELATKLAGKAGKMILENRHEVMERGGNTKSDGTVVTHVDEEVQKMVYEAVLNHETLSKISYIHAEEDEERSGVSEDLREKNRANFGKAQLIWVLDPLDGTKSYMDPMPQEYAFSLGVLNRGRPLFAVVAAPGKKQDFRADAIEKEVRINRRKISRAEDLPDRPIIVVHSSKSSRRIHPFRNRIRAMKVGGRPMRLMERTRSVAYQAMMVALGQNGKVALTSRSMKTVDSIPPAVVLEILGFEVRRINGDKFFPITWRDLGDRVHPFPMIAGHPEVVEGLVRLHQEFSRHLIERLLDLIQAKISHFRKGVQPRDLMNILVRCLMQVEDDEPLPDGELVPLIQGTLKELASSDMFFSDFMNRVNQIVDQRVQALNEKDTDGAAKKDMKRGVAVALLMMANFLKGETVSPLVFDEIAQGYLEGRGYRNRTKGDLERMSVSQILETYREERTGGNSEFRKVGRILDVDWSFSGGLEILFALFNALEDLRSGSAKRAWQSLLKLRKNLPEKVPHELQAFVETVSSRIIKVHRDGNIEVMGEKFRLPWPRRDPFKKLYAISNEGKWKSQGKGKGRAQGKGRWRRQVKEKPEPVYIDLIGNGYIHPSRYVKILEIILFHPEKLPEGILLDDVHIQLSKNVVHVRVLSLDERYEELAFRKGLLRKLLAKLVGKRALSLSQGSLGIRVKKVRDQIHAVADDKMLERFHKEMEKVWENGEQPLKMMIPIVLDDDFTAEHIKQMNKEKIYKEQVLRAIWGNDYNRLKEKLHRDVKIQFYLKSQVDGHLAEDVAHAVNEDFGIKADQIEFVMTEQEEGLYGLDVYSKWVIEGTLDAKKLILILEGMVLGAGVQDPELEAFLKKADPDAIDEMNQRKLLSPKKMFEEFDDALHTAPQAREEA